jgi:DNA-binding XRE family transcriptional regulator
MKTKNAIEIIKKRLKLNPELQKAYVEEKRNYFIACKIREFRKRARLTQKQLAQKIGTKQSVISRLENADYAGHSLSILKKISMVLQEPLESFLFEESKDQDCKVLIFHIPPLWREAASFANCSSTQVIRSYAR